MLPTASRKTDYRPLIPLLVGLSVALLLYCIFHWWGFWVLFPWIGAAMSFGVLLEQRFDRKRKGTGRRIALLLVMPALLLFVPIANNENLQLEGIVLLLSIGFFRQRCGALCHCQGLWAPDLGTGLLCLGLLDRSGAGMAAGQSCRAGAGTPEAATLSLPGPFHRPADPVDPGTWI